MCGTGTFCQRLQQKEDRSVKQARVGSWGQTSTQAGLGQGQGIPMGDQGADGNCQTMQPRVASSSFGTQEAENIDAQVTGAHLHSSSIDRHSGTVISKDLPLGGKQVSSKVRQSVNPDRSSRDGHSGDEILDGTHQVLGKDQVVTDTSQPAAKVSSNTNEGCSEGSESEVVNVRQLRSASQFTMAIQVGDRPVKAVVDSAAEVTIVSDKVYEASTQEIARSNIASRRSSDGDERVCSRASQTKNWHSVVQ